MLWKLHLVFGFASFSSSFVWFFWLKPFPFPTNFFKTKQLNIDLNHTHLGVPILRGFSCFLDEASAVRLLWFSRAVLQVGSFSWETGAPGVTACRTPHAPLLKSEELMTCQGGGSGLWSSDSTGCSSLSWDWASCQKSLVGPWDLYPCSAEGSENYLARIQ